MFELSLASCLLAALPIAMASQDNHFYSGWRNPNVGNEHYYKDAINVLEDLEAGEFSELQIRYHGCV
jgi:hypothetical protein